jgi:FlaA1/EpsC-like NDP-sugar epimerase
METSQKALAQNTMMSGAMVNQYIQDLQHKGWLTVEAMNGKNYAYRLTELGQQHRLKLKAEYVYELATLFGRFRKRFLEKLSSLETQVHSLAIFGASELSELLISVLRTSSTYHIAALLDQDQAKHGQIQHGFTISPVDVLKFITVDAVINASFMEKPELHQAMLQATGNGTPHIITL